MKESKTIFILLVFLVQFSSLNGQNQHTTFSKIQLQDDLNFLKLNLEKHHPNLYVYSSHEEINQYFKNLENSITHDLNTHESLRLISSVSSIVKDGHFVVNPDKIALNQFYSNAKLFPLDIFWNHDNAYIIRDYYGSNIKVGGKIISINGFSVQEIKETIFKNVLRDGNNITYPSWILNNFFRAFYNFYFGSHKNHIVVYEDENQEIHNIALPGLTHSEIKTARQNKFPKYSKLIEEEKGIDLQINSENKSAVLIIRSFENKRLKTVYNQKFKKTIKNYFEKIEKENIQHLIIDIRGNQGGEVTNGLYLLKHLMSESIQAVRGFRKVDKSNYNNLAQRNKKINGTVDGFHEPLKKNNYKNDLYLMVNGGSFSCSGIVANALKNTKRAILVGEETGGSAFTLVGAPDKILVLPNTKIQVTIPTHQFILQDYENIEKTGVIPNYITTPVLSDIIESKDIDYELIMELIKDKT